MNQREIRANCQKCGYLENRLLRGLSITTPWCCKNAMACDEIQDCPPDARIPKTKPTRRTVEGAVKIMRTKNEKVKPAEPKRPRGRPTGSKNRQPNSAIHNRIIATIEKNLQPDKFPLGMNPHNISKEIDAPYMSIRKYCQDLVALGTLEAVPIGRIVLYRPVTKTIKYK